MNLDNLDIEFMMLSDRAEAINGKLYIMGGGWDRLTVPAVPGPLPFPIFIAVSVLVPYNLTNRKFTLGIELQDADNTRLPLAPDGSPEMFMLDFETGRPPGLPAGRTQRTVMTLNVGAGLPINKPGLHSFVGTIDGHELKRVTFDVVAVGAPPSGPPT